MTRLEVVPFSDAHLEDAASLLAARHTCDRRLEPLLPKRFEKPAFALQELESAWRAVGASGAAALRGSRLTGYLVGAPREDETWGENIWVEFAGHAVEEPEAARDLYGLAAARWVEEGRTRQYALLPATDQGLVEAWFRLGFGQQHAHGVQEVPRAPEAAVPKGIEIRRPGEDEIDALLEVDLALPRHQQASPVFSSRELPSEEELRTEWVDALADDEEVIVAAYVDGRPVAAWSVVRPGLSRQHRGLGLPDNSGFLGFASTLPEFRGSGIGLALTDASFQLAAELGYTSMITDWRVTNLLSSRFWPKRGFRTFVLRLYRSIP